MNESTALCAAANLAFIPLGVDTFGASRSHGRAALANLFKRLATEGLERFPGQLQAECWQRFSIALHKGIGAQLSFALHGGPSAPFQGPTTGSPLLPYPGSPRAAC